MSATLAQIRTYLEEITHTTNDATFPGSAYELQLINKAYEKTAYKYDWPQTLKRWADPLIANVDRYTLQTDFRKFKFLYSQGYKLDDTDMEHIYNSFERYAVALDSSEYLLANAPTTASTAFTIQGAVSAGSTVTVTLDTVTGISAGDEIFISDTTNSEFTKVQSVDSTLVTITVKLANAHSGKILYRTNEMNYFQYQKLITLLSSSGDIPILPSETHLIIPYYAAYLYYDDIEEPDRAASKLNTWNTECDEAWLAFSKTTAGEAGEMTI